MAPYFFRISVVLSTGSASTVCPCEVVVVARSIELLKNSPALSAKDYDAMKAWFREYLTWLTTHPYGLEERAAKNNHGICWSMQAAEFAHLVGDDDVMNGCAKCV